MKLKAGFVGVVFLLEMEFTQRNFRLRDRGKEQVYESVSQRFQAR